LKKLLYKTKKAFMRPYFCALFFIAIIPLLPEYFSFISLIVAVIFAIKDTRRTGRKIRMGSIGKLLTVFCTYQTLTCIISARPVHSLFVSLMWWFFLLGYLVLVNTITSKRKMRVFLFLVTVTADLVGAIALVQYYINIATNSNTDSVWR
jgi:hypothetical protein